jgi:hypothetical protein
MTTKSTVGNGGLSKEMADRLMRVIDEATKDALARLALEAFRFDADYCPVEGWVRVKLKIRPAARPQG